MVFPYLGGGYGDQGATREPGEYYQVFPQEYY